jgi:hypothetical protein
MLRFHGTPLTPRSELLKMAGKHFCVSYANPGDADWCMDHGQSVLWDNGQFSAFTQGKPFDEPGFIAWVEPRLGHPHWAVIPDVIDGTEAQQREMIARWPFGKWLGAPVWHLGLSIDWLLELAAEWPRICWGSSAQYWQVGSPLWCRRADEAFNAMEQRGLRPWVHMLRGLALCGDQWPFASADSVNVARNFKNKGEEVCPERMARMIDGRRNSPIRWRTKPEQKDMFAA